LARLDLELERLGAVTATSVLRADAVAGRSSLAAGLGLEASSPPLPQAASQNCLVWRSLPQVNPWRLRADPDAGLWQTGRGDGNPSPGDAMPG